MGNIIDYVESEFHTMKEKKFNTVDSLILSQVTSYVYDDLVGSVYDLKPPVYFKDLLKAECFDKMFRRFVKAKKNKQLLFALASSPRFRDIKINYYISKIDLLEEKQFSATTFILDDEFAYLAFRGTDSSVVGWKEDFNMSFISPIPSQLEGVKYVNNISNLIPHKLYIGGHSKGGNIAVYSSIFCNTSIRDRIESIYSHDGPGFPKEIVKCNEFQFMKNKINKTIPYSSLVGILLTNHEHYHVVKSSGVGGFMQHDPFLWEIEEGDFVYLDELSSKSKYISRTLNSWINEIPIEKRKQLIESLFNILNSTNVNNISDITLNWRSNFPIILESIKNMDADEKSFILELFRELALLSIKNIPNENKKYVILERK